MRESRCAQAVHMLLWQCYLIDPAGCVLKMLFHWFELSFNYRGMEMISAAKRSK